jgi:glycosyltransferase involved in cell wall biosynthesis
MTSATIAFGLLAIIVIASAWFYFNRTKRLLNRSREGMERFADDAFRRIEGRLVYGLSEYPRIPEGKNVWAIVFTFDRKEMLLRTLTSLREQEPSLPVLVIDNGSKDGTREMLVQMANSNFIHKVLFNRHEDVPQWQKSFAVNQALKLLSLESPDYLVWLDDDLDVERPFVDTAIELLEILQPERVKVVSMTDNDLEESHHPSLARVSVQLRNGKLDVKIRATFNGQFNFFGTNFFRELGAPPIGEGIRNYAGEDWYYSRRLQALDYRAVVWVAAKHEGREHSKREEIEREIRK